MKKLFQLLVISSIFLYSGFNISFKNSFLSPEKAFQVEAIKDGDFIKTKISIADKIHIYAKDLKYYIDKPKNILLKVKKPQSHKIGNDEVYEKEILVNIPLSYISSKINKDYTLAIEFLACADSGICYQPIKKTFSFKLDNVGFFSKIENLINGTNSSGITSALKSESSIFIILIFFIFGLLLSLTPCIFPMVPILSSIIISEMEKDKNITSNKTFFISLIYVLSMSITYTIVGVLAGLLGVDIQASIQNPFVISIFAIIFIALALSLFGYYQIKLPSKFEDKINSISKGQKGNGLISVAIMGFLSAFIIGPCVAPPLAGAVLFISQTQDAFLGGFALFFMSLGLGFPLLLIGLGAGKFMPKPGGWMTTISHIFGVIMLGLAIFMLSKILTDSLGIFLWSILAIGTALYMGILDNKIKNLFIKILAFILLIYGSSLFIGFLSGASSIFSPFEKFSSSRILENVSNIKINKSSHLNYSLERLLKEVKESKKPVIVEFTKDSCVSCEELEKFTFSNPMVKKELKRFTFLTIDLTKNTKNDKEILKHFKIFGTPNIIFFNINNKFLENKTLTGFIKATIFTEHLKNI